MMDKLYDLKEMLCEELKEYGAKDSLDMGGLEIVDKLAHAIKNIDRIIEAYEMEEEGMSMRGGSYRGSYAREGQGGQGGGQGGQGGSYRRGGSYARGGGRGRGQNARRDSMGRYASASSRYSREGGYSRHGEDMVEELRMLMEEAPDEQTRKEIERLVEKLEQM